MNYLEQLETAVVFIENNLNMEIRVGEVAENTGYSYYHFHRVFEAALGETVGNYIRSRRIARAANDLIYTDKKILDIAVEYQFESQEAFSRAFKKIYHVTPGVYRKNRIDAIIGCKHEHTPASMMHLRTNMTIQPVIKEIETIKLVGIKGKTSLQKNKLPMLWKIFNGRVDEIRNRLDGIRGYGVCELDPDFDLHLFDEQTETVHFIGAEVSSFDCLPAGMESKIIPAGRYSVFTHRGRLDTLNITYNYIWGTWVLCSGCEIDARDDFEFYDERFLGPDNEASEMEIYIPVK